MVLKGLEGEGWLQMETGGSSYLKLERNLSLHHVHIVQPEGLLYDLIPLTDRGDASLFLHLYETDQKHLTVNKWLICVAAV